MDNIPIEYTFGPIYEYSKSLPKESTILIEQDDIINRQYTNQSTDSQIKEQDDNYNDEKCNCNFKKIIDKQKLKMKKMQSIISNLEQRIQALESGKEIKNIKPPQNIKEYISKIKNKPSKKMSEREFNILLRAQYVRLADPFPFYASKINKHEDK